MVIKKRSLFVGIILIFGALNNFVHALDSNIKNTPNNIKTELKQQSILNTEQVLREVFGYDDAYVAKFKLIAEKADVNLDKLLFGQVDSKIEYSTKERAEIVATLKTLVSQQFSKTTSQEKPIYTASAGAPGSGKTFALEQMFDIDVSHGKFAKNAIYVGPDSVVLPQMSAHLADCKIVGHGQAYAKWRDASNYIANFMFIKAMTDKLNIVHDTTLTNPRVKGILETLQELGYVRQIHFFVADKESRAKAIMHRKQQVGHTMVALTDSVSKAAAAYERIADHSYEGRVDLLVMHAQQGPFWLGKGNSTVFAVYNPNQNPNIQILADGQPHIEHMLKQMASKEDLKPELQVAVQTAVKSWAKAPTIKESVSADK